MKQHVMNFTINHSTFLWGAVVIAGTYALTHSLVASILGFYTGAWVNAIWYHTNPTV